MRERERARYIYREREGRWRVGLEEENGRRLTPLHGLMASVSSPGFNGEEWGGEGEETSARHSWRGARTSGTTQTSDMAALSWHGRLGACWCGAGSHGGHRVCLGWRARSGLRGVVGLCAQGREQGREERWEERESRGGRRRTWAAAAGSQPGACAC
jgi:hypothetical protein